MTCGGHWNSAGRHNQKSDPLSRPYSNIWNGVRRVGSHYLQAQIPMMFRQTVMMTQYLILRFIILVCHKRSAYPATDPTDSVPSDTLFPRKPRDARHPISTSTCARTRLTIFISVSLAKRQLPWPTLSLLSTLPWSDGENNQPPGFMKRARKNPMTLPGRRWNRVRTVLRAIYLFKTPSRRRLRLGLLPPPPPGGPETPVGAFPPSGPPATPHQPFFQKGSCEQDFRSQASGTKLHRPLYTDRLVLWQAQKSNH